MLINFNRVKECFIEMTFVFKKDISERSFEDKFVFRGIVGYFVWLYYIVFGEMGDECGFLRVSVGMFF